MSVSTLGSESGPSGNQASDHGPIRRPRRHAGARVPILQDPSIEACGQASSREKQRHPPARTRSRN